MAAFSGSQASGGSAGHWVVEFLPNGSTHSVVTPPVGPPDVSDSPWDITGQWQSSCSFGASAAGQYLPHGYSASVTASGTVQVRVSWSDPNSPAPSEVFLIVNSNASWSGDSGQCDDGLGDKPIPTIIPAGVPGDGAISSGVHVIRKVYTGSPIEFDLSPSASYSATQEGESFGAGITLTITPTQKAVEITCDRDMTFHKEGEMTRASNEVVNLDNVVGDTAATEHIGIDEFGFPSHYWFSTPTFFRNLFGPWAPGNSPYNQWTSDPEHWEDTLVSEIVSVTPTQWEWSVDDMLHAGLTGTPFEKVVHLTVTDNDGHGDAMSAQYMMRVHAPAENPVAIVSAPMLTTQVENSNSVTIPYGGVPVTDSYSIAQTITITASIGGSAEGSFLNELFKLSLNVALSGSASISVSRTRTVTWTPCPSPGKQRRWWFERRGWYRTIDASWDSYDEHGFQSKTSTQGITFRSADAQAATLNDYDDRERFEDAPIP
ncbi:MAG TPA: hypothetical protein VHE55_05690 [Fimbriimonadaceae bacterium]|nr:hypothetical protein [Fimbriimonadaceae bacterium]